MWIENMLNIYLSPKNPSLKNLATYENNILFRNKFIELMGDALNRYHIENCPETVSQRVLLQSILWYGMVCFYKKEGNVICLPCMADGSGLNVYGEFSKVWVYGYNGFVENIPVIIEGADESSFLNRTINGSRNIKDGVGVVVYENYNYFPFIQYVEWFTKVITDTYRTLDVCRQNIKRPFIITAEESIVNTVKEYFKKVQNNENYIISSGVFPAEKVTVEPFDQNPNYLHAASELVDWYEQKFRELCGYRNMGGQIDKKGENLIQAEITHNDEYTRQKIENVINVINSRLEFCNDKLGTKMECVPNIDMNLETEYTDDLFRGNKSELNQVPDRGE